MGDYTAVIMKIEAVAETVQGIVLIECHRARILFRICLNLRRTVIRNKDVVKFMNPFAEIRLQINAAGAVVGYQYDNRPDKTGRWSGFKDSKR